MFLKRERKILKVNYSFLKQTGGKYPNGNQHNKQVHKKFIAISSLKMVLSNNKKNESARESLEKTPTLKQNKAP